MDSLPRPDVHTERLHPIKGSPPDLLAIPSGCPFHPRCPFVRQRLRRPRSRRWPAVAEGRVSACHFWEEVQDARAHA